LPFWLREALSRRLNLQGKRYGVLEGGYNHAVLGDNVKALLA